MSQQTIRIFVSSPSDVQPERERVNRAVERLQHEFGDQVRLELFRWEETYYTAREGFQQQIEKRQSPADADLVLCILWKRLGSTLPKEFNRPDGSPRTGTEYEFEIAMEGALEHDIPDIFLYRKSAEILFHSDRVDQEKAELQALNAFWGQWVRNEEGHFTAGFKEFEDPEDFEALLENDLRIWLQRRFQTASWPESKGSPYRGLEVFYAEHADVFFGRRRAVREIRARLLALAEKRQSVFLMIVGPSGSGKSSIIRAGLLPALQNRLPIPGVAEWRYCAVRPTELGTDLLHGLAQSMAAEAVLPEVLEGDSTLTEMLTELWRSAPNLAHQPVSSGLGRVAKSLQKMDNLKNTPEVRLLLLIDQLEELFHYPAAERDLFLQVIETLAKSHKVWVVTTLRSDLYGEMQSIPRLVELKSGGRQYDVLPPGEHELREIITDPATMAGLKFEQTEEGTGLDERLLDEAKESPGALPLLEYTLSQLYDSRDREAKMLTVSAYENMGGLRGAIGQKAEAILKDLPEAVQNSLTWVLLTLVTISNEGRVSARAQPIDLYLQGSRERSLVDAFLATGARLLTTQEDSNHNPVVRVSHEALLTHWQRAKTIIEENKLDIELRAILEQEAGRWQQAEQQHKAGYLRQAGKALEEARDLLRRKPDDLSSEVRSYIENSIEEVGRKAIQRSRIRKALGSGAGVLVLVMAVMTWFAVLGQLQSKSSQAELLLNSSIYLAERGNARGAASNLIESIELNPENPVAVARLASLLTQRSYPLLRSEIKLFDDKVWKIIKSPDGKSLAVLSQQGDASIIDIDTGTEWSEFMTSASVEDVAFSHDGGLMAVKTELREIQLWNLNRKEKIDTLIDGPSSGTLVFSETGRYLLGRRLWEISEQNISRRKEIGEVQDLVFARFLNEGRSLLTVFRTGKIDLIPIGDDHVAAGKMRFDHESKIRLSAISKDGRWLATSGDEPWIRVWDLGKGVLLRQIPLSTQISGLTFDQAKLFAATLSGSVISWDAEIGSFLEELKIHEGAITDLAVYEDLLFTASWDGTARISSGKGPVLEPIRHAATVYSIASGSAAREVFTGSVDGTLRRWEYLPSGFRFDMLRAKHAVDLLSHDEMINVIAVVSDRGRSLEIHNRSENNPVFYHSDHAILHVGVSPDGERVRWVTAEGEIFNIAANAGTLDGLQPELLDVKPLRAQATGDWNRVALQISPRRLRLWNTDRNFPMSLQIQTDAPIQSLLAMQHANLLGLVQANNKLSFWDLKTGLPYVGATEISGNIGLVKLREDRIYIVAGKQIQAYELQNRPHLGVRSPQLELVGIMPHNEDIVTLDISDDGLSLVSSSLDGSLRVWDTVSFSERLFVNLGNPAYTVDISPNGNWLVAGSQDGTVRTIDLNSGTPVADSFKHTDSVVLVQFDTFGNQIVSVSAGGDIQITETGLHLRLPPPRWLPDLARRVAGIRHDVDSDSEENSMDGNWQAWRNSLNRQTPRRVQ